MRTHAALAGLTAFLLLSCSIVADAHHSRAVYGEDMAEGWGELVAVNFPTLGLCV